uniref:DRBM domain-containing protein n=1 Tax=Elaeophora elaphi TaxID=1147741 RepID=A0A0R3RI16_9BILA
MIEKESFTDFGLGKTKDEALANLESMTIDFQSRGSGDDSVAENWVGKVNERCQKLKLSNPAYEIDEEGPPNQRIFIATCKIGNVHVVAHGKTKKIAKTLAAQKMCSRLENWNEFASDIENAALAAASIQEVANNSEFTTNDDFKTNETTAKCSFSQNTQDTPAEATLHPGLLHKVRSAFQDGFGTKGLTEKLTELIKSGDENISKVFPDQELKFVFLERDIDGNFQCMLSLDSPVDTKNAFYGFGATEQDAKDYASRNALVHLDLFVGESSLNSSDPLETQGLANSSTPAKNSSEDGSSS